MSYAREFRCPRYYFGTGRALKLQVFVGASQSYWQAPFAYDDVQAYFVSKMKCAPLKTTTISRLELQAAMLETRLMNTVK